MDSPLPILEIGAEFNTPDVVRWPLGRLARKHPHARFVRMNREHAEVPAQLGTRALGSGGDAGPLIQALAARVAGTPRAQRQ